MSALPETSRVLVRGLAASPIIVGQPSLVECRGQCDCSATLRCYQSGNEKLDLLQGMPQKLRILYSGPSSKTKHTMLVPAVTHEQISACMYCFGPVCHPVKDNARAWQRTLPVLYRLGDALHFPPPVVKNCTCALRCCRSKSSILCPDDVWRCHVQSVKQGPLFCAGYQHLQQHPCV